MRILHTIEPSILVQSLNHEDLEILKQAAIDEQARRRNIQLDSVELELLRNNRIIPAVTALNNRTGIGLIQAKNVIDTYRANN